MKLTSYREHIAALCPQWSKNVGSKELSLQSIKEMNNGQIVPLSDRFKSERSTFKPDDEKKQVRIQSSKMVTHLYKLFPWIDINTEYVFF